MKEYPCVHDLPLKRLVFARVHCEGCPIIDGVVARKIHLELAGDSF
jgi:hypothetical protein